MSNVVEITDFSMNRKFETDVLNLINALPGDTSTALVIGLLEGIKFNLMMSMPDK